MSKVSPEIIQQIQQFKGMKMKQSEVAKKLAISISTVNRYWNGNGGASKGRAERPPMAERGHKGDALPSNILLMQFAITQIEGACKIMRQAMAS